MENLIYSCRECDCKLWSDYSKNLGLCPECIDPESDSPKELEERLRKIT